MAFLRGESLGSVDLTRGATGGGVVGVPGVDVLTVSEDDDEPRGEKPKEAGGEGGDETD